MPESRKFFYLNRKYFYGLMVLSFISVICAAFRMMGNNDFEISRREVLLRRIGHEMLLQSGDSVSRVLPIKKSAENEYQISFENELSFQPELLVNTTRRLIAEDPLSGDYVVNVLNAADLSVVYGFAISKNKKDDIVACFGRVQPRAHYIINIKLKPQGINTAKTAYLLGSLSLLAIVGFVFLRSTRSRRDRPENSEDVNGQDTNLITLGSVLFDMKNRTLTTNGEITDLTGTETRVLSIFALSPNETIERSRLQKEIWEDEGVIVGRSLDMFISKLRKKLESDPNIKITVIRGKGYKLEIGA